MRATVQAPRPAARGDATAGGRAAAWVAWCCGSALLSLVLWTLPGFFGPRASHPTSLLAAAALGYLCCGPHPLSRRGRWLACGLLAAAAALWLARSPAAGLLIGQAHFLATAWEEGATPAVPALIGWPLVTACAWPLAATSFEGLRRARPVTTVLLLIGWLAVEWEFVDRAVGVAFWPAAALALLWLAAGRAQALAGRAALELPAGGAPRSARRAGDLWRAWRPLLLAAATGVPLLAFVALLPLNHPALGLGAFGRWLRRSVPAVAGIERAVRLPGGASAASFAASGGQLAPNAGFGLQMEGFATSDAQLGGPLTTDGAQALRLTVLSGSPPPVIYLRGDALDTYTGRGWVESPAALQRTPQPHVPFFRRRRPSFTFRVEPTGMVTSTLFTALTPLAVDIRPVTWDRLGNAWLPDPLPPSASYTVRAVPPPDPAALPALPSRFPYAFRRFRQGFVRRAFSAYLQLPPSLPAKVGQLARRWAGHTTSPLGEALAVERHLLTIPYDLNAPAPPAGSDFVAAFLFQLHRGYCTYYASAMAVMLRTLGIPTRWVTGFRVPTPAPGRTAVVTDAQAHAWVEAFVAPYGWLTFDPTPPGPTLSSPPVTVPAAAASATALPADAPQATPAGSARSVTVPGLVRTARSRAPVALAAALAVLAALGLFRRLRGRRLARLDPVTAAHRLWRGIEREAARRGCPRPPGATPGEFARSLAELWPAGSVAAARLAESYGRLCYGPESTRTAAAAELGRGYGAVATGLRRLPHASLRARSRALLAVAHRIAGLPPSEGGASR